MKKVIFTLVLCAILLSGCGEKPYKETVITEKNYNTIFMGEHGLTTEEKEYVNQGTIPYFYDPSKMYGKTVNDIIEEGKAIANKPKTKLSSIHTKFVTELWNEVFCNISWYVYDGTNSVGENLDIEYTLRKADNLMAKRDEYNEYVNSLSGDEYSEIKYIWSKLIVEIDRIYADIKAETPRAKDSTYKYNTGNFETYSSDLSDEISKLN